ncbi:MAG TPA: DNA mismatch repair protein MutS [Chloroflexi bacterium]|jgi:DNA mismatch repair protein MutS|nr:DNA mismatch repair protein MutS [Chloroflexota bacterium]HAF19045.1 DNA mismatch repair protein MutS [Chloroflexota bacterium]
MRQYREAKEQHPEGILLFRLGDFYEVFFDDALIAAPVMGVTLTSRPLGKSGRAPMCGVPYHAWQLYVGKLLRAGHKVVICDQVEAPGKGPIVKRDVTRVLTPGTVVEDSYLDPTRPNYLVAAWTRGAEAGLAACDVSTGELLLSQLPADRLSAELERLAPAELLTPPEVEQYKFDPVRGQQRLRDVLGIAYPAAVGAGDAPLAVGAAGVVLDYLKQIQTRIGPGLLSVRTYSPDATMPLDAATVRNLELPELVKLVDHTRTPIGARRLRTWLGAPLRDAESIELRLSAVDELVAAPTLQDRLATALKDVGDLERLVSRAAQGRAGARDLVALRRSLDAIPAVRDTAGACEALAIRELTAQITIAPELTSELQRALIEDPPVHARDGGAIRRGYDDELDGITDASQSAREWIAALEASERRRTGIRSLKVGFNKVFGYYIEISNANTVSVPTDYIRKQTLTGAERYLTPELKEKEAVVLTAQERIAAREVEILRDLGGKVAESAPALRTTAQAIGSIDALRSLAVAATHDRWRRPSVNASLILSIKGGRHPLVERHLADGAFVANDLKLDPDDQQITILTGPNMAGKSTFLRQAAVIVLLAQCGSFVPADSAVVGLVDRIFTRVGAHDDITAGMSTFMVEMTETANILNHATRSSLVILDEVGRGTSTYDGLSIAQAVVEYMHDSPRLGCRTLFATHYHELTALAERLPRVRNERVEVLEEGETVRFLHHVVPGGADRSYGIHVAALAGLPSGVIARARQVLAELERQRPLEPPEQQLGLPMEMAPDPLRKELEEIQPDTLSPLEALQKLYELRSRLDG